MGMFDWYVPSPPVSCPRCGTELNAWRGKSGPCALFEWVQGDLAPVRQLVDDEVAITPAARSHFRLPAEFELYTSCSSCSIWIRGLGICENGSWRHTTLLDPIEAPGLPPGWVTLDEKDRMHLLAELVREIVSGHVLHGCRIIPLARRGGLDDVPAGRRTLRLRRTYRPALDLLRREPDHPNAANPMRCAIITPGRSGWQPCRLRPAPCERKVPGMCRSTSAGLVFFLVGLVGVAATVGACASQPQVQLQASGTAAPAPAAAKPSGYDKPPKNVLDVLHAPSPPIPVMSPTGDTILLVSNLDYQPIERIAEPFLKLAGVRLEPRTRRKHDTPGGYGITPCALDYTLVKVANGAETKITLPKDGCVDGGAWAADGRHFAFRNTSTDAVELWVVDAATGAAHVVPKSKLNPMFGFSVQWMADGKTLLAKLVPENAGAPPAATIGGAGPSIQETGGQKGESSTYEARDTLRNKDDEALFDYYGSSQLALIDAATGQVTRIGAPGILARVDVAPDGEHILVDSIKRPYSYVVTAGRFPHDVEIWDHTGKVVHRVASLPLADRVPIHGVPTGPRDVGWRENEPATLTWAEALDGGDWNVKVPARDKVMMLKAPFTAPPVEIVKVEQRFQGFYWAEKPGLALLGEDDENRHWTRTFVVNVDDPGAKMQLLWDHSSDEHYKHPGDPVVRQLPNGAWVLVQDGDAIFLAGEGSSPDGDRPFLDRLDLKTKESERLFRSDKTSYERFVAFSGAGTKSFVTWHQSPADPPNAFLRTLGDRAAGASTGAGEPVFASTTKAVTHLLDPTPAVRAIKKRLVKYKRKDGTDLSFTLYTPPDYQEGQRVPAILYAYPLDYADPSTAGQVTGSEQTFTRLRQYRLLLLAGYAIIDNAAFPIVGDPKKAYDTYLEQLVADATAAVDKAVEIGVVDPERVGVTGHSHGALMTANLLAHSDLFRAGAATSGSYNKTLTPFGFQNERRSVWDAQPVYLAVSPFFFADKMKLPILIVHGEEDANPGTTPLQAVKLYEAIRGNGGTARLVMLPHEPHWYSAMESQEQLISEMIRWFDRYVKDAKPRIKAGNTPPPKSKPAGAGASASKQSAP